MLRIFYIISRAQLWREECSVWRFFSRILCWEFWRFVRLVFLCVWRVFIVKFSAILRFLTCFRTLTIGFGFASYFDNRFSTPFCFWRSILTRFGLPVSTLLFLTHGFGLSSDWLIALPLTPPPPILSIHGNGSDWCFISVCKYAICTHQITNNDYPVKSFIKV